MFIAMDFIDLQEKEGKGFNCEQLLILCVIRCHGIWVLTYRSVQPQADKPLFVRDHIMSSFQLCFENVLFGFFT